MSLRPAGVSPAGAPSLPPVSLTLADLTCDDVVVFVVLCWSPACGQEVVEKAITKDEALTWLGCGGMSAPERGQCIWGSHGLQQVYIAQVFGKWGLVAEIVGPDGFQYLRQTLTSLPPDKRPTLIHRGVPTTVIPNVLACDVSAVRFVADRGRSCSISTSQHAEVVLLVTGSSSLFVFFVDL